MRPISVLLTNSSLGDRAGSEIYVRDVALALQRRNHRPVAFSLVLGEVAAELRRATIPVVDDLARLAEPPDIIHGHHHFETMIATLAFPGTPVVNFCHGWIPWEEMPLRHPAVQRYVAVDEVCVDRLVREEGIPPASVELLLNFVDLDRFRPRPPLPPRPRRALVLSNLATTDNYAATILTACRAADIQVDIAGFSSGNPSQSPETLLRGYDLVFAKGKAALEALAVGCAVVLADRVGAGPMVTPANYPALRMRNFGLRELSRPHDAAWFASQISLFSAASAAEVSARIRAEAGLEPAVDRLLDIYSSAIGAPVDAAAASRASAAHCCRIAQPLKRAFATEQQLVSVDAERRRLESELAVAVVRHDGLAKAAEQRDSELAALRSRVDAFQALPTLRLRDAVLRAPVIGRLLQVGARQLAQRFR